MSHAQIAETCCRDLRRYLENALRNTRGGVVSVKMKNMLRVELSWSDRMRYARCLNNILRPWRWGGAYVIPRRDVEKLLETFDELCQSKNVKQRNQTRPRRWWEEYVFISVALPDVMVNALDTYARLHNTSRSAVIRDAIQQLIEIRNTLEELDRARVGQLERVALRLPRDLLDALNHRAATLKASRAALVRYAIYKLIEKTKTEPAAAP